MGKRPRAGQDRFGANQLIDRLLFNIPKVN